MIVLVLQAVKETQTCLALFSVGTRRSYLYSWQPPAAQLPSPRPRSLAWAYPCCSAVYCTVSVLVCRL